MRKLIRLTLSSIVVYSLLTLTSCKYEEGPGISFRTKKARVEGTWRVEESFTNGEKDSFEDTRIFIFTKEGKLTIESSGILIFPFSTNGEWEFINDKESIKFFFNGNNIGIFSSVLENRIMKLKNKEMWLERTDELGDIKELHLIQE